MAKRYISNDTAAVMFIGGVMIQPGEGRDVDETFLPPELLQPADEAEAKAPELTDAEKADANLRDVLKGSISKIKPLLPDFSPETLARLLELEQADGTPRQGLVQAITELQLQRAQAATGGAPT